MLHAQQTTPSEREREGEGGREGERERKEEEGREGDGEEYLHMTLVFMCKGTYNEYLFVITFC